MNKKLIDAFKKRERRALARIITMVENETAEGIELLNNIYKLPSESYRVGITGPPGVGKSTTVNALLSHYPRNEDIGIIAVDPSSPFTGGAILGDRLRMTNNYEHENVFIRSVASRGSLGGLSASTENIATLMERFGKKTVLIETVGVGQSELDIMETADTVVVILVPESGDSIQAMKAGIMEIGDIFVINKCDREGADRAVSFIRTVLSLNKSRQWDPPVIKMSAKSGLNTDELHNAIAKHRDYLKSCNLIAKNREAGRKKEIEDLLRDMFIKGIKQRIDKYDNAISPYEAAKRIMSDMQKKDMEDLWKKR